MPNNQPQVPITNSFINNPQQMQQQNMAINNQVQNVKPVINNQQQQQPQLIQTNIQQQQQQRNQVPQPINQQPQYLPMQQQVPGPVSNQTINHSGPSVLNMPPVVENDEAYKRKIEELKTHLPRLEKMYANSVG